MKKKLALLLASVMTLSSVSVNLFAASTNDLSKTPVTAVTKTVFVEQVGTRNENLSEVPTVYGTTGGSVVAAGTKTNDDLKYLITAPDLHIKMLDPVLAGSTFHLNLTNAEWFFRNAGAVTSFGAMNASGTPAQPVLSNTNNPVPILGISYAADTPGNAVTNKIATKNYDKNWAPFYRVGRPEDRYAGVRPGDLTVVGPDANNDNATTYAMDKGVLVEGGTTSKTVYKRYTYTNTAGSRDVLHNYGGSGEPNAIYTLEVYATDASKAYVTINQDFNTKLNPSDDNYGTLVIPLVTRTLSNGNSMVSVQSDIGSNITNKDITFASNSSTLTKTYVDEVVEARRRMEIEQTIIAENRVGSLQSGVFQIEAPSGFYFLNNFTDVDDDGNLLVQVLFEGGLSSPSNGLNTSGFPGTYGQNGSSNRAGIRYKQMDNNEEDTSVVQFNITIDQKSSLSPGTMYITNLTIIAEDDSKWGDVNLKIKSVSTVSGTGSVLTDETFLAARRVDWVIDFYTTGDIPTLTTGRYIPNGSVNAHGNNGNDTAAANAEDDYHKTAVVVMKEKSVAAWFAKRDTKLVLPEEVKVRKLQIKEVDNMLVTNNKDYNELLEKPKIGTSNKITILGQNGTYVVTDLGDELYPNDGALHGYVKVDDNVITLTDLETEVGEKAEMELHLWVSISANYSGDVTLGLEGSGVLDEYEPIVIAKTVKPVAVDTKVTDINIGHQYYPVADFTITETSPGMLEKGKEVRVSISDAVSSDMAFTPGFTFTAENIKIKDAGIINGTAGSALDTLGEVGKDNAFMSFTISAATTTNVGVIKFSGVQVKIDRTVPESSVPYDLIVWGTAIAENYGRLKDQFQDPGVRAPYVKVVTSAGGSISSTIVLVTIGDPVIQVGPDTFNMDTAAYISEVHESTMIPVRYVAVALGVDEDKVDWDPLKSTVTIDASTQNNTRIVQMTTGSDQMLVNGIARTMYSPNMTPVSMEINDERSFVPFRALGEALGVKVGWDPETRTAIYNPDKLAQYEDLQKRLSSSYVSQVINETTSTGSSSDSSDDE